MTETRCVICTADKAAVVGLLCAGHHSRLASMLRDVEDEACHLDARPSMQQRMDSGKGSLASERAPVRLEVVVLNDRRTRGAGQRPPGPHCVECWHGSCEDIRAWLDAQAAGAVQAMSILDVLGSWARLVREERDLAEPDSVTITGERDLLTRQLDWVAAQPWVDEAYSDLRTLLGQLRSANGTTPEKPAGRCPDLITGSDCGGPVWVDGAAGHAYCSRCRRTWDGRELNRLGLILEAQRREAARPRADDGEPMLTAAELVAKGYVSSPVNVRVKAHRLGLVSVDGHYDPRWFTGCDGSSASPLQSVS